MKKVYILNELDCANCAAKMERLISNMEGVSGVNINFMTKKMELEAKDEEFESIAELVAKKIKKIERQVVMTEC